MNQTIQVKLWFNMLLFKNQQLFYYSQNSLNTFKSDYTEYWKKNMVSIQFQFFFKRVVHCPFRNGLMQDKIG